MQSLTGSQSLLEVTLDGNPVSDNPSTTSTDALAQQGSTRSGMQQGSVVTYRQKLICQIPNLRQLDMKRISVSDININVRFINCSQTKFVAIILVLSVFFFMRFFAWQIFRLTLLTFRPQKRDEARPKNWESFSSVSAQTVLETYTYGVKGGS